MKNYWSENTSFFFNEQMQRCFKLECKLKQMFANVMNNVFFNVVLYITYIRMSLVFFCEVVEVFHFNIYVDIVDVLRPM